MLVQYSCIIFIFLFILYRRIVKNIVLCMKFYISLCKFSPNMVSIFWTILKYKINRKMQMLQEYWVSTIIFSQCSWISFQCIKIALKIIEVSVYSDFWKTADASIYSPYWVNWGTNIIIFFYYVLLIFFYYI